MTREESAELLAVIKVAYPQQLGNLSEIEANAMVGLWADTFRAVPKQVMEIAAKEYIRKNKFFPSINAMCEELDALNKKVDTKLQIGFEEIDENGDVKFTHYDEATTKKLEFIRQSTADFAINDYHERRADGAKDWLIENIQDKQLQIGGGN